MIIVLGALTLFAYIRAEYINYGDETNHLIDYTISILDMDYVNDMFDRTMEIYDSIPEEERQDPFSDEYIAHYVPLIDDKFYEVRQTLVACREKTENRNMFFMFTDPEHSRIVYVIDGDELEWVYIPGQWIESDMEKIDEVEKSEWRLNLTKTDAYGVIGTDYYAIRDGETGYKCYLVMDVDMNDFYIRIFSALVIMIPGMIGLILLTAYVGIRLINKSILKHLDALADTAREYTARDKVAQIDENSSYFENLNIQTGDELEDLWTSMTDMEEDINMTMRRLQTITAERERMEAELSIATQIQEGTLPHDFPAFPERNEFDIYASMTPAKEVGGDFYDFFLVDDDHLALEIADVSGKGISAALFMVNAKAQLQNQTMASGMDIEEIFRNVNARLIEQNEAMLFVTCWLGIMTLSTGEIIYVDAGHEYPAIRRNGGLFTADKDIHGGPLAAVPTMKFRSGSFRISAGDTVFLYTDGVTEANNNERDLFGTERLLSALNREPDASPRKLDENVRQAIEEFIEGAPQFDDTTMLCLKYYGPAGH